jgi:hypothetical protein
MEMHSMSIKKKSLTILELKRLLTEILDQRPDICVRYRLIGAMWNTGFTRVVFTTDSGAFFRDETHNRLMHVSTLDKIIQFEIDHTFQNFEAHFHYDVVLDQPGSV